MKRKVHYFGSEKRLVIYGLISLHMSENNKKNKNVDIRAENEDLVPKYANLMQVSHQHEEFMLDFFHVAPPHGILNARLIVSPGHMKRMIKALEHNLKTYEERFGDVKQTPDPSKASLNMGDIQEKQSQLEDKVKGLKQQKLGYEMIISAQNLLAKCPDGEYEDEVENVKNAIDELRDVMDDGAQGETREAQADLKDAADALGEKIHAE